MGTGSLKVFVGASGAVLLAGVLSVAAAGGAAADSDCRQKAGSSVVECDFTTVGATEWTVPAGVKWITVDLYGAQGGNGQSGLNGDAFSPGGKGGRTKATLPVAEGFKLQINVGGAGSSYGWPGRGYNGGAPNVVGGGGGGGGGASDLRIGDFTLNERIAVAGGGGGAGGFVNNQSDRFHNNGGAGGGRNGEAGQGMYFACSGAIGFYGGSGATTTADGQGGGLPCPSGASQSGSFGVGGTAGRNGGGGGGGYYGGGGGAHADGSGGGGGGGSGNVSIYARDTLFETGVSSGHGRVTIEYYVEPHAPNQ